MRAQSGLFALAGLAGAVSSIACNGFEALCDRPYSNVSMVGSHDSAFVGYLPSENQFTSITDQLNEGIRFLTVQTHNDSGTIEMCHTYCWLLDAGPLSDYLTDVYNWMNANPNEVVTLLITNQDAIPITQYGGLFSSTGLVKYVFTPTGTLQKDQWPTLQQMIEANTRLVVLMDYNADTSKVPYILPEFNFFWETTYDVTASSFPDCAVDRPGGGDPAQLMGIMNHFLDDDVLGVDIPDELAASNTNSEASILAEMSECAAEHGGIPMKVILTDYVSIGDAVKTQNYLNGV